jgi:hypothetical protein
MRLHSTATLTVSSGQLRRPVHKVPKESLGKRSGGRTRVWRYFMATVRLLGRSLDRDPTLLLGDFTRLSLDYGDGPCPASRRALDLRWKAAHGKAGRWQRFEIVKLLDMTISDVTTRLVALPDE